MGRIADALRDGVSMPEQKKRQMLALDREFVEMETQIQGLKTKVLHLEAKVNPLEREIERLKDEIKKKRATVHKLQPDEISLLKFIGERQSCTPKEIQTGLNMHPVQANHLTEQLREREYVEHHHVPMVGAMFSLTAKGNAYLVENQLVPLAISEQLEAPSNPKGHHCDHCGSDRLRRIGSKPDPQFGVLGVKAALYTCLECKQESSFTDDRS